MKWNLHIQTISKTFKNKLWTIRRLKSIGGSLDDMRQVYITQIRPVTETACPAWNSALTQQNIDNLEKLQKLALKLILENKYISYENALKKLKLTTLKERRLKLSVSFSKKTVKNDKYSPWFKRTSHNTRQRFANSYGRTTAYQKSPLPYLTNLLNQNM